MSNSSVRRQSRRTFMAMTVAAAAGGTVEAFPATLSSDDSAPSPVPAVGATYLVIYRRGPGWVAGKPLAEQVSMREHFAYYVDLYRRGLLQAGGGFADGTGGAAIFKATDDGSAQGIITADPAVASGVLSPELKQWRQNPWAEISRSRAARGL